MYFPWLEVESLDVKPIHPATKFQFKVHAFWCKTNWYCLFICKVFNIVLSIVTLISVFWWSNIPAWPLAIGFFPHNFPHWIFVEIGKSPVQMNIINPHKRFWPNDPSPAFKGFELPYSITKITRHELTSALLFWDKWRNSQSFSPVLFPV